MKKNIFFILIAFITFTIGCGKLRALKEYKFEEHHDLSDKVYMSIGWGGNSGVIFLQDSVIIIDTKMKFGAEKFYHSLKDKIAGKKIYIINTHLHNDHTDGNYLFNAEAIYIPDYSDDFWNNFVLKENKIKGLNYVKVSKEFTIREGNDIIRIIPVGAAHTEKDMIVYYENEQILFTGDLLFNKYHPYLDKSAGADAGKWANALKSIINDYEIKYVVPGHGPVAEKSALSEMAGYFNDIIDNQNDENKLAEIQKKYGYFDDLPGKTSFAKTVEFIKQENKQ